MKLSAQMLDTYDRCERRYAYSQNYEPKSISPLGLIYIALEAGIQSDDPEQTAKDATMEAAQNFELQLTDLNAFTVIRHCGYLAGIIAFALREKLGILSAVDQTETDEFTWESGLWEAESGTRHRIELISHFDDDRLRSAAHSWMVIGELAALEAPLHLTQVVIGAHRGGRRHSAWSKAFLHPQNHGLRFGRRQSKQSGFSDGWEEVWREHRAEISTAKWINQMRVDGVLDGLIFSRKIAYRPEDNRMKAARQEMVEIAFNMRGASETSPMRRSSCDETGRGACPYQPVCYSPIETSPDRLVHLYCRI
jgi:hypothetical protein